MTDRDLFWSELIQVNNFNVSHKKRGYVSSKSDDNQTINYIFIKIQLFIFMNEIY